MSNEEEAVMYCIVGGSGVSCVDVCGCFGSETKEEEEVSLLILEIGLSCSGVSYREGVKSLELLW